VWKVGFIDETREYLAGKLRRGETIGGKECATFIHTVKAQLPGCVKRVLMRADGEFLSWQSIEAALSCGFKFIIANKGCEPRFDAGKWYKPWKRKNVEFNSCNYQPIGWKMACRFVAMRIPKEIKQPSDQPVQCVLFEDDRYTYRIFCTNLAGPAHKLIDIYDKRADVENLVGEAKREGLDAIPSGRFKSNYAFFQIVMLAYNIWRYMKILAQQSPGGRTSQFGGIMTNTIRIARLKLLFIAAKVVRDSNRDKVRYSIHDFRTPALIGFLDFLDTSRKKSRPWENNHGWPQRFAIQPI